MASTAAPVKQAMASAPRRLRLISLGPNEVVAVGALAAVTLMILPVPATFLDILLAVNLAIATVLLLTSVLTTYAPHVYTFPSMLVLSTFFRLGLDISSMRLILTRGEAGHVIQSFGDFAAGGSIVTGLVIFLVIAMVGIIVLAKGAEGSANVVSHFVKESIVGKQQEIELDLQRGAITPVQAVSRRRELTVEVDFWGRMTGAIQFIKGDSIAGLVVSGINIVGGLIVGVAIRHLSIADAAETYTLLTVGAGLVSQIPAMIGLVAASLLISRVSPRGSIDGIGGEAVGQFLAKPMVLILAAATLFFLGVVPGMPVAPFWAVSMVMAVVGYRALRTRQQSPQNVAAVGIFDIQAALEVALPPGAFSAEGDINARCGVANLIALVGNAWGVPFPVCKFTQRTLPGEKTVALYRAGLRIAERNVGELMALIGEELTYRPARYFGVDQARQWFEKLREYDPALVESALAMVPVPTKETAREYKYAAYAKLLASLLEERVPLRDARTVLQTVIRIGLDQTGLCDRIRVALHESSAQFYRERYQIRDYYVLDKQLGTILETNPTGEDLVDSIESFFRGRQKSVGMIQVPDAFRRRLWEQIERKLYEPERLAYPIIVIGYSENPASPALHFERAAAEIPTRPAVQRGDVKPRC